MIRKNDLRVDTRKSETKLRSTSTDGRITSGSSTCDFKRRAEIVMRRKEYAHNIQLHNKVFLSSDLHVPDSKIHEFDKVILKLNNLVNSERGSFAAAERIYLNSLIFDSLSNCYPKVLTFVSQFALHLLNAAIRSFQLSNRRINECTCNLNGNTRGRQNKLKRADNRNGSSRSKSTSNHQRGHSVDQRIKQLLDLHEKNQHLFELTRSNKPKMNDLFQAAIHPHCRYNPFNDSWVLVSPHRTHRPWQGEELKNRSVDNAQDDLGECFSNNYLAPNAIRASGQRNADYKSTFSFENDFPALLEDVPECLSKPDGVFGLMKPARGVCKVLCLHPDPMLTWATMNSEQAEKAIQSMKQEYEDLANTGKYKWIQIFENRGVAMGCSNPHPHCQIWASEFLPDTPRRIQKNVLKHYKNNSSSIFADYTKWEQQILERIVCENNGWLCVVPFWAVWPYETMILQKVDQPAKEISELTNEQIKYLAAIIQEIEYKVLHVWNQLIINLLGRSMLFFCHLC
ncbi:hypothetical protein GJ496_011262 [Pomphorhynchus laevis]|nr:hypothetical protein GJ496_011262 [Pomphorhynchus laevis]